jgi:hypothetical protein
VNRSSIVIEHPRLADRGSASIKALQVNFTTASVLDNPAISSRVDAAHRGRQGFKGGYADDRHIQHQCQAAHKGQAYAYTGEGAGAGAGRQPADSGQ